MIIIQKGKVDVSVVIGAAVVFAIIGAAIFGVYYFAFVKPAQEELEDTKTSALNTLDSTLAKVDTSQANTATATYRTQIQGAGSKDEVTSIAEEVATAYARESKREELLNTVESATKGSFYSTTGTGDTTKVQALAALSSSLTNDVNSKTTLSQLEEYEQGETISSQANTTWKNLHTSILENLSDNRVGVRRRDSPEHVIYMSKDNAQNIIQTSSWSSLREMRIEGTGSYEIPIVDTFQRTPTIKADTTVDVYMYDYKSENLSLRVGSVTVSKVIYPKDLLGTISWSLSDGATSYSYSTDVWEAIKAAKAGDSEAANVEWSNYAQELMNSARNANVGDYDLQALYVVNIPNQRDAETITQYEQYQTSTKDIILLAHTSS